MRAHGLTEDPPWVYLALLGNPSCVSNSLSCSLFIVRAFLVGQPITGRATAALIGASPTGLSPKGSPADHVD